MGYAEEEIYPKGLTGGWMTYKYSTNTLTLNGIEIKCTDRFIYNKKLEGLRIVLGGLNSVICNWSWGIFSMKDVTIEGSTSSYTDNQLYISNSYGPLCLWLDEKNGSMTLKNLFLDVNGSDVGIFCRPAQGIEGTLTIDNCTTYSQVSDSKQYSAIHGFKTFNLEGCGANTAKCAVYYSKESCGFKNVDGTVADAVIIEPITTTYNGITILGTPVTNLNKKRVLVEGLTQGLISYDSSTKVLELGDVILMAPKGDSSSGLSVSTDAVSTIYMYNTYITTESYAIRTYGSGTITLEGYGVINCTSTEESGLSMEGSGGFVFNVSGTVNLVGQKKGIWGNGSNFESSIVTMKNNNNSLNHTSYYTFKGIEHGAINNVADVKREGMDYYFDGSHGSPGCYFNNRHVRWIGGEIAKDNDEVAFKKVNETYGISVAGTPINDCNKMGVGSKYIKGVNPYSVIYDPTDKELILTDATIDYDGEDKNIFPYNSEKTTICEFIIVLFAVYKRKSSPIVFHNCFKLFNSEGSTLQFLIEIGRGCFHLPCQCCLTYSFIC